MAKEAAAAAMTDESVLSDWSPLSDTGSRREPPTSSEVVSWSAVTLDVHRGNRIRGVRRYIVESRRSHMNLSSQRVDEGSDALERFTGEIGEEEYGENQRVVEYYNTEGVNPERSSQQLEAEEHGRLVKAEPHKEKREEEKREKARLQAWIRTACSNGGFTQWL